MSDNHVISIKDLDKNYRLYESATDQAIDVFGLSKIIFWKKPSFTEFHALRNVNLNIEKGERVGIVGRNGAGKSTLLKLITGNFEPSSGEIKVKGDVQALMSVGLGFHPEFSGLENIKSSLIYNGIPQDLLDEAVQDVIEFSELEEFLEQPMKTYSLGMQARLMFGAATAITPDILIVDEVLGAGDAYFGAKSAHRMERLTGSGCSLLLVSHSSQQILQFCERAIWIERGRVVKDADALSVVKAYEEFTQKLSHEAEAQESTKPAASERKSIIHNSELRSMILKEVLGELKQEGGSKETNMGNIVSNSGISRWKGEGNLLISGIELRDSEGELTHLAHTGETTYIDIELVAETADEYPCVFVLVLYSEDGKMICRSVSESYKFKLSKDEKYKIRLEYPQMLLGNGTFTFSASIYRNLDLHDTSTAKAYDLLSRSFQFDVVGPYRNDSSLVHPPCNWTEIES